MIINTGLIDWITLTTFSGEIYRKWHDTIFSTQNQKAEVAKRMQYRGVVVDGVFLGQAVQQGRRHAMLQCSGERADEVFPFLHYDGDVKCTRIDLQVTIDLPMNYDARALYDGIKEWQAVGKPRAVSLVESGDGLDTVYIGSRQSDRFTRIYVKPLADGARVIRFETEFKGQHASHVVQLLIADPNNLAKLLAGEVDALPELKFGLSERFLAALGYNTLRSRPKRKDALTGGLRWLMHQVDPAILRLMNDHEVGYTVRNIIRQWARAADEIDGNAPTINTP